jgi:hypothetical protein
MSKKVLKLAGRQPMLLALIVMATFTLGLLFSGWLTPTPGKAQPNQPNPPPNVEGVNTSCLSDGYVTLDAPTNSPLVAAGSAISLTAGAEVVPAEVLIVTTYSDGSITTGVSEPAPTYAVAWAVSGVGAKPDHGTGLTATFTPTNSGCGIVSFSCIYTNQTPCGGSGPAGTTGTFSVAQLSTNCTAGTVVLGKTSPITDFWLGSGVAFSATNNNITNVIVVTTDYPCSATADTYVTSLVVPTILTNWWTFSYGSFNTNGIGLSTIPYTPTNAGSGTVVFNEKYKNNTPCDTNVYGASLSVDFNIISVTLSNVTFGGGHEFHQVYRDADGSAYPTPQWTPSTNYPVCYTRNNPMKVTPGLVVAPSTFTNLLVQGISSGPQLPIAHGTSPTLTSANLPPKVDYIPSMTIDWQCSIDNGTNWHDLGTSANKFYVTLNDPDAAITLFHTVLWLACSKPGAVDEGTAVANTWSLFGGSGPANLTTWDGKPLYYYKANCGWANSKTSAKDLLSSANTTNAWAGHGQCYSFANLLHDSLAANGIISTHIALYRLDQPGAGFTVNNWSLGHPSFQYISGFPPYIYWLQLVIEPDSSIGMCPPPTGNVYRDLTKLNTLPGQNTAPPCEEAFGSHHVVRYPPNTGKYYDPSYGATYVDDNDFESKSVAGYYLSAPGGTSVDFEWEPATGLNNIAHQENNF